MLPDEVKTPQEYLEYLLTINQIPEEMKERFTEIYSKQKMAVDFWRELSKVNDDLYLEDYKIGSKKHVRLIKLRDHLESLKKAFL